MRSVSHEMLPISQKNENDFTNNPTLIPTLTDDPCGGNFIRQFCTSPAVREMVMI